MATFLELVNATGRESGTISQQQELATVANATGRQRKIVNWVRQAWEMIQRSRTDWTFLRQPFEATLTVGQTSYDGAALGITDLRDFLEPDERYSPFSLYDSSIGRGDETRLERIDTRAWLDRYDFGAPDPMRPNVYALGYDGALLIGPPPDKAYKVRGWYLRTSQSLTADADTPYIPAEYHDAIMWRALVLLGEDDEAGFEVASSSNQFAQFYSQMVARFTPGISL